MNDRKKLIELMIDAKRTDPETGSFTEHLADYLIANGVTFAKDTEVPDKMDFCGVLCNFAEDLIEKAKMQ